MEVDYLIIGQGISGTFLSYYLKKEKQSFLVIDDNFKNAPSKIAAGIINPVTGRRLVTVWMASEILPFAWKAYGEIGDDLGIETISQKSIIDFFPNPFMRETYLQKIEAGDQYVHAYPEQNHFNHLFNNDLGCGEIRPVYTAHVETLLPAWRSQLQKDRQLLKETFDISHLKTGTNNINYKNIVARKIIFCDGTAGIENPFFNLLPFAPNKGEALVLHIPDLPVQFIYKKSMLLAPIKGKEENLFWVGSNYMWDFENADPTTAFRENTERMLKQWLKIPFKVLEHRAGLRPATLERRPFVGLHPTHNSVGILNGMGTKGCSLAPYFAKQLADHLIYQISVNEDADIKRFTRILARS